MARFAGKHIDDAVFALTAVIIAFFALCYGGTVGFSDNGDFSRVMEPNGISYTVPRGERSFVFINTYRMDFTGNTPWQKALNALFHLKNPACYPSVQHLFIKAAVFANIAINLISKTDIHVFRIEVLGAIYILLYGFSLFILFAGIKTQNIWPGLLIKALITTVACDMGYITYFNSFYGEALQTIFLVLSAGFGLRLVTKPLPGRADVICFYVSLVLYAWSKFANIPAAIITALFCVPGLYSARAKLSRPFIAAAAGISVCMMTVLYTIVPGWMDFQTNYNSVFFGILRDTGKPAAERYLRELGLPEYMLELRDTNYYMKDVADTVKSDIFKQDFSKISKTDITLFYMKHPRHFADKLEVAAANSGIIRPVYLSNHGPGMPRLSFSKRFEIWGELRKRLPYDTAWWNAAICMMFFIYMAHMGHRKQKTANRHKSLLYYCIGAALPAAAAINFCLPVVANGEGDLAKHMFAFIQSIDIMSVILAAAVIDILHRIIAKLRTAPAKTVKQASVVALALIVLLCCAVILVTCARAGPAAYGAKGSYIEYGSYNGQKLLWHILASDNTKLTLVCANTIGAGAFSEHQYPGEIPSGYGDNHWKTSKIRTFLNTTFIRDFTAYEKALLMPAQNKVLLSAGHLDAKAGGDNEFFWSHVPKLADRGHDRAYYMVLNDMVFVPDIKLICDAYRNGHNIARDKMYWLSTPYYSNNSMVRVVDTDGYIYMRDAADESVGILPVLNIRSGFAACGDGSIGNPFKILETEL
ncbi:MAG: DUF6273 domain-containing protein [Acetivibrionales bacterium]